MSKKLLLILIIFGAACLRLFDLNNFPRGFTADEAAMGYTAYSLLQTGRDEWGVRWPLAPRSFGDYKPPLYAYLTIPSIGALGLNQTAVRLPAVLASILSVLAIFFLTRQLPLVAKEKRTTLALWTALLLAVSPWCIQLGRGAFETGLTVLLVPLGVAFFLYGLQTRKFSVGSFVASALAFGLSLYAYHSAKLIVPLLLLGLLLWWRRELRERFSGAAIFLLLLGAMALPLGTSVLAGSQIRVLSVSRLSNVAQVAGESRFTVVSGGLPLPIAYLFKNKILESGRILFTGIAAYLSPQFLFTQGPVEGTYGMMPGRGVMYPIELIFVVMTVIVLVRKGISRSWGFLALWLVAATLPGALSTGPGYAANRTFLMVIPLVIISAFGVVQLLDLAGKQRQQPATLAVLVILGLSLVSFLIDYRYTSFKYAGSSGYGYRELFAAIRKLDPTRQIVISRSIGEPQTYTAFYLKINPVEFQRAAKDWPLDPVRNIVFLDQLGHYFLGRYEYRDINWGSDKKIPDTDYVGHRGEFSPGLTNSGKILMTVPNVDSPDKPEKDLVIVEPVIEKKLTPVAE
jgi:4-amino-4-deoxy-L-arabinose transferase-like glycosyltransferase